MTNAVFAKQILTELARQPSTVPAIAIDESRRKNAGRCMAQLACNRLLHTNPVTHLRHGFFEWQGGRFALRNSRIADSFWTNLLPSIESAVDSWANEQPVAYLFIHWDVDDGMLHAWAIPAEIARTSFAALKADAVTGRKTVLISLDDHQLHEAAGSPSFAPYYTSAVLTEAEQSILVEAIKTDDNVKQERFIASEKVTEEFRTFGGSGQASYDADEEGEVEERPIYTSETVAYLLELPKHINDGKWHERNKRRYERVLRDPSQAVVDELSNAYIQRLNAAVAGGKRHLSILKKNDYGKGGYHDHFWFAFYDPASGSKTKSVQLFVRFLGGERVWRYGLCMGNYCEEYMERLLRAIGEKRQAVASYCRHAPQESIVRLFVGDSEYEMTPDEFALRIENDTDGTMGLGESPSSILIIREYALATLPDHSNTFVEDVGGYFTWAWPFFDAALSGKWQATESPRPDAAIVEQDVVDVDESAPQTIDELAELTALPADFLTDLEEALLAKQQAILVGPPGTSKTYIARQFARYFVRQREGRPQGSFDVLFVHANWGYEDFFEGLKPTSNSGSLTFEPRLGYFLEWIERLKEFDPRTFHVLVLDEINRCDTAAVLGELLQLLEYRGTTVRLLSGRSFVFPKNVYVIGTMNSADRSIGRMDLALRRRFMWLNLYPRPDALQKWLDRRGNNRVGFEAADLARCNELLAERDIPPEQQIGHALFMLQRIDSDDEASPRLDVPLSEQKLRQIVRFSVLPYVRELVTLQCGKADDGLLQQIREQLLRCLSARSTELHPGSATDGRST